MSKKRILVVGTFNSGSTALAGAMERLGVDMCGPLTAHNEPKALHGEYDYRFLHGEPPSREEVLQDYRCIIKNRRRPCAVKTPFNALVSDGALAALGKNARIIWIQRDLEISIARLRERRWTMQPVEHWQSKIYKSCQELVDNTPHPSLIVPYNELREIPYYWLGVVAHFCKLHPTTEEIHCAANYIR
jgi:hypothetical protein